jgi:transcriptional regulator with PAS, ATPase and Fis domain
VLDSGSNLIAERLSATKRPLIIASDAMKKVMSMLQRIAASPAAVLITGETGTGKELIATAVHEGSLRHGKPMIDINCGALPEHLVESELFGYEKGAFSGADQTKKGLFELANGGTLFLDEIGELAPSLQVKLLRVLDSAPYYRLGGNTKISVDVRIIAATNQPLDRLVESGDFRRDLYYRLRQFQLNLPPLRERKEDTLALARHFLSEFDPSRTLAPSAVHALMEYHWPGNVRELKSAILQAATLRDETELTAESFILPIRSSAEEIVVQAPPPLPSPNPPAPNGSVDLVTVEKQAIIDALDQVKGHQGLAAARLGISRRTLSRKLKQYQIERTPSALGFMNPEQQLRFRFGIDIPVEISARNGAQITARSLNISCGGMSLREARDVFSLAAGGELLLKFDLPDCAVPIRTSGKIVWTDTHGNAGVVFTSAPREVQLALGKFLRDKQSAEGWQA